ncbi:hypothetical protein [Opitutus sp. ER46]|uniref:hypothetical protein n=1 Tax=Opitutus sp. ER46 TaxID=2161864 RepID=UPI0011B22957|nr:hypothetical protein [Opitutus sp. ER46]
MREIITARATRAGLKGGILVRETVQGFAEIRRNPNGVSKTIPEALIQKRGEFERSREEAGSILMNPAAICRGFLPHSNKEAVEMPRLPSASIRTLSREYPDIMAEYLDIIPQLIAP